MCEKEAQNFFLTLGQFTQKKYFFNEGGGVGPPMSPVKLPTEPLDTQNHHLAPRQRFGDVERGTETVKFEAWR